MYTGKSPTYLKEVLITLIPKAGEEDSSDIKDLRPILLSNTALKIISKAASRPIQQYADKLIVPYQRRFIKNHRINQNTMEFFSMLLLIKEERERSYSSDYEAIFDGWFYQSFRPNVTYINTCSISKIWFRKIMIRLLMLIMADQEAVILMNDCPGVPFQTVIPAYDIEVTFRGGTFADTEFLIGIF